MVTSGATPISSNSGVSHTSMAPPPLSERGLRRRALRALGKGEHDQRAAVAGAEHAGEEPLGPAAPAHRHGDVLPAVDHVGRRAAVVAAAALEVPQQLTGPGVERVELTGGL